MGDNPAQFQAPPLHALLPLRSLVVVLEAVETARPGFFHQPALAAFLRYLLDSPADFDRRIRLDAPESGRILYQPGQYYRFQVIVLGNDIQLLQLLFHKLGKLPHVAPKSDTPLPFRNNWKLHSLQDGFSGQPINAPDELSAYGMEELEQESRLWQNHEKILWQWISPVRLLKEKQQRQQCKGEARYCRDNSDLDGSLLLARVYDTLADLLRRSGAKVSPRPALRPCELHHSHFFWLDASYRNEKGKTSTMGGLSGRTSLRFPETLPLFWWQLLVLGQYTGIGQRTAFGWGRYQMETPDKLLSYRRILPAASMLQLCQEEENLSKSWRHVMGNTGMVFDTEDIWIEEESEDQPPEAPIERLKTDLHKLMTGEYQPPSLRGYLIPKKNGGVRPLAIPPVYDRVLQRSLTQVLSPALEKLMYAGSHGFRYGRSRITARHDIQAAWRAGYRWVYESDIKDFFDSVNLDKLRDRLSAIYGEDPMVTAILAWMRASVIFEGETIERRNGLPQGSPLSPLMANLMLDDFDSDMETLGFKLIRFADDFIILCKNPEQARAAGEAAQASLAEHGLELHPDKTRITAMEDGFKYLGYLFVNDMALDISGGTATDNPPPPTAAPPNSWFARLGEKEPQKLKQKKALEEIAARLLKGQPTHIGERDGNKTLLVVSGDPATISTLNKQLRIFRGDKRIAAMPWRNLQSLLLLGNHQITTQAMHAALQHDISIHLANGYGRYHGTVTQARASQGHRLWLKQLVSFEDPDKALYCARAIVAARLRHQKETLRQRGAAAGTVQIDHAIRNINRVNDLESLRGLEGHATREYYQRIATLLPAGLEFAGRNRRPPRDPFNVLLSLGHTLVYGYSQSILHSVGLLPWQGFYHQSRGRHAALASDLMEPFRHLVERAALTVILRREISAQDFNQTPGGQCRIENTARRKYLTLLLQRWETAVRARGQEEAQTYFKHMHHQALSLKAFITHGETFNPFRLK